MVTSISGFASTVSISTSITVLLLSSPLADPGPIDFSIAINYFFVLSTRLTGTFTVVQASSTSGVDLSSP